MKEGFTVTINHYDEAIMISKAYNDVSVGDAVDMCRRALHGAGFPNVDDYFNVL